jgi:SAM-dependent methyltransferase
MRLIERIHGGYVQNRRAVVLARRLAEVIPRAARVLDVGCGDGRVAKLIGESRPDLSLEGIDVLVRPNCLIPVKRFDGRRIGEPDGSFDVVMFVDVLHHADDPEVLLREAARVAGRAIVIKDHTRDGFLAGPTLRVMDWVGNARHGVALPYNYWPRRRWDEAIARHGLTVETWESRIGLYPWWASWVFGRKLHFIARLGVKGSSPSSVAVGRAADGLRESA